MAKKVNQYSYGSPCFTGYKENSSIAVLLLMLLLLICIFGFTRPDSLGAERGSSSSLYEYSIILFILVFYFSNQKKWLTILSLTVLALFVLQDIAYGGRITAIQLLVVAFFFVFNKDTKSSILLAIVACLLIFFISFGGVRTQVWEDGLTALLDSFQNILDTGLAWDTAYSAWHTSITFIQFDSLVSPSEHMYYVGQWLLSLVLGGSAVADSNLAAVTHLYFAHSYGGILPVYLAFYFGVPGIIAIAFLVSAFVSLVNRFCMKSDLTFNCWQSALRLGMLYFVATAPRWFIYSPSQLIRGLALMLILSFVVLLINEMMNKREEHKTTNRVLRSSVKDEHI